MVTLVCKAGPARCLQVCGVEARSRSPDPGRAQDEEGCRIEEAGAVGCSEAAAEGSHGEYNVYISSVSFWCALWPLTGSSLQVPVIFAGGFKGSPVLPLAIIPFWLFSLLRILRRRPLCGSLVLAFKFSMAEADTRCAHGVVRSSASSFWNLLVLSWSVDSILALGFCLAHEAKFQVV
jgi:hypothetical protein